MNANDMYVDLDLAIERNDDCLRVDEISMGDVFNAVHDIRKMLVEAVGDFDARIIENDLDMADVEAYALRMKEDDMSVLKTRRSLRKACDALGYSLTDVEIDAICERESLNFAGKRYELLTERVFRHFLDQDEEEVKA